jgi:hypothetical protein
LNSDFSGLQIVTNDAFSNYDALQLQYQRRLSRGLQVLASYSWAHALDNWSGAGEDAGTTPYHTFYNPNLNYGNSDFDLRHSLSTAITYNTPSPKTSGWLGAVASHWSLDSLFQGRSDLPVNIVTGLKPLGTGSLLAYGEYARPDLVPNQPLYLYGSGYPGGKVFNPAAFQIPIPSKGTLWKQGDLGRNVLRGFGAWQEDLAIRREFPIHEQVKLQFRAEFFNIFNHPNFGDPGTNPNSSGGNFITNPLFGLSTMTLAQSLYPGSGGNGFSPLYQIGGPRSIQLALKLVF